MKMKMEHKLKQQNLLKISFQQLIVNYYLHFIYKRFGLVFLKV